MELPLHDLSYSGDIYHTVARHMMQMVDQPGPVPPEIIIQRVVQLFGVKEVVEWALHHPACWPFLLKKLESLDLPGVLM